MSNVANIMSAAAAGAAAPQPKKYAIVGWGGSYTLKTYDISDPSNPTVAGTFTSNSTYLNDIRDLVYDEGTKTLYVAVYASDRVNAYDASDPTSLALLGSYYNLTYTNGAVQMALDKVNKFLYLCSDNSNRIVILNVSDPSNMTLKSSVYSSDIQRGMGVDTTTGDILATSYSGDLLSHYKVNSLSNPTSITLQRTLASQYQQPWRVATDIERKKFYVATDGYNQNGLLTIDYGQSFIYTYDTLLQNTYLAGWGQYAVNYDPTFDPPLVWMGAHNLGYVTAVNVENNTAASLYKFLQDATNLVEPAAIVSDSVTKVAYVATETGYFTTIDISGEPSTWSVSNALSGQGTGMPIGLILI